MKKAALSILLSIAVVFSISACTFSNNADSSSGDCGIKIVSPDGAPLISASAFQSANPDCVNVEMVANLDQLSASLQKAEPDFAIVPINLAAKIYNLSKAYKVAGVVTTNLNYVFAKEEIIEKNNLQNTIANTDLSYIGNDNTVLAFAESGLPGVSLKSELKKVNVNPKVTYLQDGQAVMQGLLGADSSINQSDFVVIPEPAATALENNEKLNSKFKRISRLGSIDSPQSVLVVKSEISSKFNFTSIGEKFHNATDLGPGDDRLKNTESILEFLTTNFQTTANSNTEVVKEAILNGTLPIKYSSVQNAATLQSVLYTLDSLDQSGIPGVKISNESVSDFFAK